MSSYISKVRRRKQLRRKGFDYTKPASYFITICAQKRKCLFGDRSYKTITDYITNNPMNWDSEK